MAKSIDAIFKEIEDEFTAASESVANVAMFEAAMDVGEQWANDIIILLTEKQIKPPLQQSTIERRERSGLYVADVDTPLIESGLFLESIEVVVRSYPGRGIYRVDVQISDDTTQEERSKISPQYLAFIHEYGVSVNGSIIPERPVFKTAAMQANAKAPAIIQDKWKRFLNSGITVFSGNKISGKTDYDSSLPRTALSGKNLSESIRIGKIRRRGSDKFIFEWM